MSLPAESPPKRRRRKRPNYWLRRFLVLLLILSPFAVWKGWSTYTHIPITPETPAPRVVRGQPVYVLLLGVDERSEDTGRSDTMLLVRLDPNADSRSLDVINIPRDTRVMLNSERSKINAAYAYGGSELTTATVADLLGIPRPYYVKLNFTAFEAIVDALGKVEIDVEKHYVYDDPFQDLHIDIPAGRQLLDGETALKYVRLRHDGESNSDIARIERQQKFIAAMKAKLASPSSWTKIPEIIKIVRNEVSTNIPEKDQLTLAKALFEARDKLTMTTLPGVAVEDGTGDWVLDPAQWQTLSSRWKAAK